MYWTCMILNDSYDIPSSQSLFAEIAEAIDLGLSWEMSLEPIFI